METAVQKIIDSFYQGKYAQERDFETDMKSIFSQHKQLCKTLVKTVKEVHEENEQLQIENKELNALLYKFETHM